MADFHVIIPAGGSGTRLWPLSRADRPKFLLDPTGHGRTLLQATWDRLVPLTGASNIHVVTGTEHAEAIGHQLPELQNLIIEPDARDSMPAIGLALSHIAGRNPRAVVGTFAADHLIDDPDSLRTAITHGIRIAETERLCTIGITPTHASDAYGYIQTGSPVTIDGAPTAHHVSQFVEKPDASTAQRYLDSGHWLWNAGMYLGTAAGILQLLAAYQPRLYDALRAYTENGGDWSDVPPMAIDYAIAQPAAADGNLMTIPAEFGWKDIGDFAALADIRDTSQLPSDELTLWSDADGLVINTTGRAISVLGIADAVVVDTGDNLLITTRSHAQHVKDLPAQWRARGRDDLT